MAYLWNSYNTEVKTYCLLFTTWSLSLGRELQYRKFYGILMSIFKGKGSKFDCDHYRGIIFNTCFVNKKILKQWKESVSTLFLKRDKNNKPKVSTNIFSTKNWRETSLSVTLYKLYMMLIKKRLLPRIFETEKDYRERDCNNMYSILRRQLKTSNTNQGNFTWYFWHCWCIWQPGT